MSEQLWAICTADGDCALRVTDGAHPAAAGHREECAGARVHRLKRAPRRELGETIDSASGELIFSAELVAGELVAATKAAAGACIEQFAPVWRQINDINEWSPAAAERTARIRAVREASNAIEARIAGLKSPAQVERLRADIAALREGELA